MELSFAGATEQFDFLNYRLFDFSHLEVSHLKISQTLPERLLTAAGTGNAKVGEDIDLGDAASNRIAEIIIAKTAAAMHDKRNIDTGGYFRKAFELETGF
jgi:hypothetical protein